MNAWRVLVVGPVVCSLLLLGLWTATPRAHAATCTSSVGPGIPPPASVPSGVEGFHAQWYGQSGYPTLCPGDRSTAVVAYYNSGTRGWVSGRLGEMAFLGTWGPLPGQDQPSILGGDGTNGSPATGWPRYNRVAAQPADYVGPGQVSWFQFTIQAPQQPGVYRLYIRPLVEGANWMEDFGVFWQVTVQEPVGAPTPTPTPPPLAGTIDVAPKDRVTIAVGAERSFTATLTGIPGCVDLAFVDGHTPRADGSFRDLETDTNGFVIGDERADFSTDAIFTSVNGLPTSASFIECVGGPSTTSITFTVTSFNMNAFVRPVVFRDANATPNRKLDLDPYDRPAETTGVGGAIRFLPPSARSGNQRVNVFSVARDEQLLTDLGQVFRWKDGDTFSISGTPMTRAQFEQMVWPNQTINMNYNVAGNSSFDLTGLAGFTAPQVGAMTGSFDGTGLINDVRLTITEPSTNVDALTYTVSRASSANFASCSSGTGTYSPIGTVTMPLFQHTVFFDDHDLAPGTYCYAAQVNPPAGGALPGSFSGQVVLTTPPGVVFQPAALDTRLVTVGNNILTYSAGAVIKVVFNEPVLLISNAYIRARDVDGTMGDFVCGSTATCTTNDAPEVWDGQSFAPGSVLTVTLTSDPRPFADGSVPGLQVAASIIFATGIKDKNNQDWSLGNSTKLLLNYPPQR